MSYGLAKNAIYQLKRLYALTLDVYYPDAPSVDLETGKMTQNSTKVKVRKAVKLPNKNDHTSRFNRSYIRSAVFFVYGGEYDTDEQVILIDMADLPSKGATLTTNCWLIINHARYEIKTIVRHEESRCVGITCIHLQGAPAYEKHDVAIRDSIAFGGDASNTVV